MTDREKLIELLNQADFDYGEICVMCSEDGYKSLPYFGHYVADYLLANGVIVPPCNLNKTYYDIGEFIGDYASPQICEVKADFITIWRYDGKTRYTMDGLDYMYEDFGKVIFESKEEAEKALAERSKSNDS